MTQAKCPKSHTVLAIASVGKEYGHVPGHNYHDVDVVISRRGVLYRVEVVETHGSAQGYDEEHGRRTVTGGDVALPRAVAMARQHAADCGMHQSYLTQALSQAEDAAQEWLADNLTPNLLARQQAGQPE